MISAGNKMIPCRQVLRMECQHPRLRSGGIVTSRNPGSLHVQDSRSMGHDKITIKITDRADKITERSRQVIENKGSADEKVRNQARAARVAAGRRQVRKGVLGEESAISNRKSAIGAKG
jgi:hypothetical protein